MNIAERSIANRTVTLVLTVVGLVAGYVSYQDLSRLEDPVFTIKDALVITPYPGASAYEVEEEVSDKVELAAQQLGQLKEVESKSDRGLSTVTVRIQNKYDKTTLPQVWDELRRKVGDMQGDLPPGAGPSLVLDDYGDVWGVFVAIFGAEYSHAELREFAKLLRRELLLVQDVAKIDFWGDKKEAIYVEPLRDRLSQLGIDPQVIARTLQAKNVVTNSGRVQVGPEFIAIEPTGAFDSVEDIGALLISQPGATEQIHLRDVARIRRGYVEPPSRILRYDGQAAIGLGISTSAGGNVVRMGEAISERMRELQDQVPLGVEIGIISLQSDAVVVAIDGFVISLVEAVAIVVAILLLFMGLRSGLLIGFILVLTITATFIFMGPWNVALERISLGALIIALGMLVDNAIVVTDGMLVRIQRGQDGRSAARDVVAQTAMPLLGATVVAIMAFASIGTSQDSTGEFCRSLFQVVFISLGLSWLTAVTVTPLLCLMVLKPPAADAADEGDAYGGAFYDGYRKFLGFCLRFRWFVVCIVGGLFCVSLWGFQFVDRSFFPDSTRPQFMVDAWLPQGTHIEVTGERAQEMEEYLAGLDGVTHVTTLVGGGAMRFLLTYTPEKANTAYVQFLVDVDDYEIIPGLIEQVDTEMRELFPDALSYGRRFIMGPGDGGKIQARFRGPDPTLLRELAERTIAIVEADGGAKGIRSDWRQPVKVIRPVLAEEEADLAGITRTDVSRALLEAFQGEPVGVYRESDELLPILQRAPEEERGDVSSIGNLQIWSPVAQRMIPMRQVVAGFETVFEDEIVMRLNRMRTITVHSDPVTGAASRVLERIRPAVEALELPPGYELQWWGESKSSREAQAALASTIPGFVVAMVLIVIALFNNLRQPTIIWLCVPLALIGVTAGLLLTAQPFGFMALLGFLSLSGMLIKNAIVLIDEINAQLADGKAPYDAIVGSAVSRLRPVAMAASTTALGMIPLLVDAFFVAMAVTIIAGLMFATLLTMIFVPVLYSILYRVTEPA